MANSTSASWLAVHCLPSASGSNHRDAENTMSRYLVVAILVTLATPAISRAADKTAAKEFFTEPPTLLSLGFEWRIDGDDNRNATVAVSYRKKGDQAWKEGLPLLRIGNERIN